MKNLILFVKKDSPLLRNFPDKFIGTMIGKLTKEPGQEDSLDFLVAHTTPSMGFGFLSSNMKKPTVHFYSIST